MCKTICFSTSYYKKTSTNSSLPFVLLFDFQVVIKYDQHFHLFWLAEGCLHELHVHEYHDFSVQTPGTHPTTAEITFIES
jgi:hypothetical protein